MIDNYQVHYSADALDDLREIYAYIANGCSFRKQPKLRWDVLEKKSVR